MVLSNQLLLIVICLVSGLQVVAQNDFVNIPLNPQLGEVEEIRQVSDDQGNLLLQFRGKDSCQYDFISPSKVIQRQTVALKNNFTFLEYLYDENHFDLFYRNENDKSVHVYHTEKQTLSEQILKTNLPKNKERNLADCYHQGDFLVFKYSKSPFTLHTYRYEGDQRFEKQSQVFQNSKKERSFLGQIITAEEVIFVRLTRRPFTLHFYRYRGDGKFEKKSIDIRSIYQKAGAKRSVSPTDTRLDPSAPLSAYFQGDKIYLDMEHFVHINPTFSREKNRKTQPGILQLDWENGESEIISFDQNNDFNFSNRSVTLFDRLYFKLLVNKKRFELSVFEVTNQKLLKKFSYDKNQKIELLYDYPRLNERTTLNVSFFSNIYLPVTINTRNPKVTSTKKLLRNLSQEALFLDIFGDKNSIELRITGINEKDLFLDQTLTISCVAYLSMPDLQIIKPVDNPENRPWAKVNERVLELQKTNKDIGEILVYSYQEQIHIAYIDQAQKRCIIIAY